MKRFVLGLDLGMRRDHSALIVNEHSVSGITQRHPEHWHDIRHIERFPLGTSYTEVVTRVVEIINSDPLRGHQLLLAADATGVGRPVVEAMSARLPRRRGLDLMPITITAGDQPNSHNETPWRWWNVPKRDLVSSIALALEQERHGLAAARRLQIAAGLEESKTLVDELRAFRVTISASANDSYGAWRERDHDDLVLAVACAVWSAEREWHRPARVWRPTGRLLEVSAGDVNPRFGNTRRGAR